MDDLGTSKINLAHTWSILNKNQENSWLSILSMPWLLGQDVK